MTTMKTLLSGATLFALTVLSGSPYSSAMTAETKATSQAQISITQAQLDTLLDEYKLSGVSLAVIDNYEVVLTASSGEKRFGSGQKIDDETAFSTASISKPVTALLVAMLEEQGKLSLDDSVSKYLKRWKLNSTDFPNPEAITFRRLLSHTAGTTQGGFVDYYEGDDVPTAIDSLNGVKVPRYDKPISLMFEPGTSWAYSGGGYVIVQIALEDLTGMSLPELAQTMLFEPLNMSRTTMYQPNHDAFLSNVASVHNDDLTVIGTGLPICPQIAPSGMWSTPTDMAKLLIEMQNALAGKQTQVISDDVARTTTHIETLDVAGGWGLGWMRTEAKANQDWFSHGGSNTGTGGHIMGTMDGGRGIAIFGNGGNPARIPVIEILSADIMAQLGWNTSIANASQKADQSTLKAIEGTYDLGFGQTLTVKQQANQLVYEGGLKLWSADTSGVLVHVGDGKFATDGYANLLSLDVLNNKKRLMVSRQGSDKVSYFPEVEPKP